MSKCLGGRFQGLTEHGSGEMSRVQILHGHKGHVKNLDFILSGSGGNRNL